MSPGQPVLPLQTRLGSYELVRLLAQGGMADVYLARQLATGEQRAVKVLNQACSRDAEARALFLDEARLLGMLRHDHLAAVHEADSEAGVHYLAMEYIDGADLRGMLAAAERQDATISYEAAVSIIAAAAHGLDHAHRRCSSDGQPLHLVHRDVSLSNIMVGRDGGVKVVDFGIATATISSHETSPGVVRGKTSYMSPEQCLGDAVDLRTDVFALGIVLYELTTRRRCFAGNSDFERMLAVVQGNYVRPTDAIPDFPVELAAVIERALALDPDHRFPSAAALIEALERAAAAHGWMLGTAPIVSTMLELFGDADIELADDTDVLAVVEPTAMRPCAAPTVVGVPRRFPRGTDCNAIPAGDHDDEPTRGRRSAPRLWRSRHAA
ncbi:MAG TPA: serine/threonine-protein kinase [Kofleriaceae bacterium]|nr:serine/threonine-protein kinase [Kofleriaceae bacterium]